MTVAVCAIVQNEAAHLAEWIAFHQIVGVQKFFLYDNGSQDNTVEIANRFDGVTVRPWLGVAQQLAAYHDALTLFEMDADWIAFIDADEYLWSPTGLPLPTLLEQRYAGHNAVGACCLLFGTSGVQEPPELRIESLVHRARDDEPRHNHVKTILRPSEALRPLNPHCFEVDTVDENGNPFSGPWAPSPSWEILRINHYVTGSIQEATAKSKRIRADTGNVTGCLDEYLVDFDKMADFKITRYLPLLKARLLSV